MGNVWCWIFTCPDGSANEVTAAQQRTPPAKDTELIQLVSKYAVNATNTFDSAVEAAKTENLAGVFSRILLRIENRPTDDEDEDDRQMFNAVLALFKPLADDPDSTEPWKRMWVLKITELFNAIQYQYFLMYAGDSGLPGLNERMFEIMAYGMSGYPVLRAYLLNETIGQTIARMDAARAALAAAKSAGVAGVQNQIEGLDELGIFLAEKGPDELVGPVFDAWRQQQSGGGGGALQNAHAVRKSVCSLANKVIDGAELQFLTPEDQGRVADQPINDDNDDNDDDATALVQGGRLARRRPLRRRRRASRRTRTHRRRPPAKRRGYHGPRQRTAVAYYHPVPYM